MARERSVRSKRKMCKVYLDRTDTDGYPTRHRCEDKIKPGTAFCKKHFETHKLIEMKCNGEAHSNPYIDHCGVCMPYWGTFPVAVPKDTPGVLWTRDS